MRGVAQYLQVLLCTALYDASWLGYSYAINHHNWLWQAIAAFTTALASFGVMFSVIDAKGWRQRLLVVCCGAVGNLIGSTSLLAVLEAIRA